MSSAKHTVIAAFAALLSVYSGPSLAEQLSLDVQSLYMTRRIDDAPLVSVSSAPGSGNVFSKDDVSGGWGRGLAAGLTLHRDHWNIGLRAFLIVFDEENTKPGDPAGFVIETNPRTTYGIAPDNTMTASYQSHMGGLELNLAFKISEGATVFAGPRWIRVTERFELIGLFGGPSSEKDIWKVENDLLGAHLGVDVDLMSLLARGHAGPFSLRTRAAVGLFANEIDANFNMLFDGVVGRIPANASASETSFLLDLGIEAMWRVSESFSIGVGYQMLYLTNISTAIGQVAATTSYNSDPSIAVASEDVLTHGVSVRGIFRR